MRFKTVFQNHVYCKIKKEKIIAPGTHLQQGEHPHMQQENEKPMHQMECQDVKMEELFLTPAVLL